MAHCGVMDPNREEGLRRALPWGQRGQAEQEEEVK